MGCVGPIAKTSFFQVRGVPCGDTSKWGGVVALLQLVGAQKTVGKNGFQVYYNPFTPVLMAAVQAPGGGTASSGPGWLLAALGCILNF